MTTDEQRGYSRGYAAGRKRVEHELSADDIRRQRQAFLDKAFLAALPVAINGNWTRGEAKITTTKDCVSLAWEIAEDALKARRCA